MIADARNVPDGSRLEADVCIVGAGPAGIALARELAGGSRRVCLLESGGLAPDPDTQALYRGRVFGRAYFRLDDCRRRRFGGSSWCWQGLCRPLDPIDFEARAWVPESGWPFGFEALRPYYERAQEVCRLEGFAYDGAAWADAARPLLPLEEGGVETRVFQVSPLRFGEVYREEIRRAPNVATYLFANAREIELAPGGTRVDALRVATLAGTGFRVRARHYVLAAGGIENARLLLASRSAMPAGVGNGHGLVGRYFMEHPHVVSAVLLPSRADAPLGLYRPHRASRSFVSGYLTAGDAARRRHELLGFSAFLARPVALPEFEAALASAVRHMDGREAAPAEGAVLLMCECEQVPNPASRVRLVEERDALGMPRVQLEWRLSEQDQRSARRANELLARALGRAGVGRLQMLLPDEPLRWPPDLAGGRHHMGTTRMHEDPRRGVVDPEARVHGIANLHVAGSSVFPTGGAANPTLTLVALALRLADHLRARLR